MAFASVSPSDAEAIAISKLNDEFEYMRIAALHMPHTVGSSRLKESLDRLESDSNEYVRRNLQELRSASGRPGLPTD